MKRLMTALAGVMVACGGGERQIGTPDGACDGYPEDAVRPMEVGAVMFPYSWPVARNVADGTEAALDLGQVPCGTDPAIDWSPFDALLFISIPAW